MGECTTLPLAKPMTQHGEGYLLPLASDGSQKSISLMHLNLLFNRVTSSGGKFSTLKLQIKKKEIL
jgi:hypothetical protein